MHRYWGQAAHKFSTSLVQVLGFSTLSTTYLFSDYLGAGLCGLASTAITHVGLVFTQAKAMVFNPLAPNLYPFYTGPNTNTKLI
jgi:hypothetical protein